MKIRSKIIIGIFLFTLVGCEKQKSAIEENFSGSYELVEEIQFDHHWASLRRIEVRGQGIHDIAIGSQTRGKVSLSPNGTPANEIMVMFMVDPAKRVATWWITDYSRDPDGGMSGRAGSPQSFKYSENAKYLSDVVEFLKVEGHHKIGDRVPLMRFLDAASGEAEIAVTIK